MIQGELPLRKIKYIISFFVILLAFLFNGESFQYYVSNVESQYYSTTFYLQDYQKPEEMIEDIQDSGLRHHVNVFTVVDNVKNAHFTEKTFYCDEGSERYIKDKNGLADKNYISIFSGVTDVRFRPLEDLEQVADVNEYYLIGNPDDIQQFKTDLIDQYGGGYPQEGYEDHGILLSSIFLWIVAGIVILVLSFYDIIYQKKENFIKISLGENVNLLILKNIIIDNLAYFAMFLLSVFILVFFTSVFFHIKSSICVFAVILVINSLFYVQLKYYDIKKALSNTIISKKLLFMNYALKLISCMLTILIVSGNIMMIANCLEFRSQKDFFQKYASFSYVHLDYKSR